MASPADPDEGSHRRIEPHALARRAQVMRKKRVHKRKKRIDRIERRPPGPPTKSKSLVFDQDEFIKNIEIDPRSLALKPAYGITVLFPLHPPRDVSKPYYGLFQ